MSFDEPVEPSSTTTESNLALTAAFNYNLNHRILSNCVLSAVLEPKSTETLVAVTVSNKIILRNNESALSIADKIKCLTTVPFGNGYDYIVVGTESQIIVYDFYRNSTVFQREVPDGINCFTVGRLASHDLLILCGGNCAIWGFDETGKDQYWTVTGDSVTTMCLCDFDGDGELELIIGSPDNEIRVFKDDLMRHEVMETDAIVALTGISHNCFVYALANGTLGMYMKDNRMWRIKSKYTVVSLLNFPSAEDLFTCVWSNGKTDFRLINAAEAASTKLPDTTMQIAAAFRSNSSAEGVEEITLVTVDGKVYGYRVEQKSEKVDKTQETLRDFGQKKHNLLMELSNFEAEEHLTEAEKERDDRIPANTVVDSDFTISYDEMTLFLCLKASNAVCIRGVIAFAEGMFEGDSFIWIPEKFEANGDEILLPVLPEKDTENDLSVRVLLGKQEVSSNKLFVFECQQLVPKFARFALWANDKPFTMPESYVEFTMRQRNQRLYDWINTMFIPQPALLPSLEGGEELDLDIRWCELAPKRKLSMCLQYENKEGKMMLFVDCMETAANIVQSLCNFFSVEQLAAQAIFSKYYEEVQEIVDEMDGMWEVRDRLTAELSETQSMVKEVIVRAEDATVIDDMDMARRYYARLRIQDRALRQAFLLRSTNHERFVLSLRRLNKIIENASNLRVGEPSRAIVAACREAIAQDNKDIIVKVMQFGA